MTAFGWVPRASVCPCARWVEAKTSPSSIAWQTPTVDGLLADRDVQEARELAGAEALLDLLLEAPDQQHLAQELAQRLLVQGAFLLDLRHGARQCTFCVVSLVGQWRSLADGLPEGWRTAGLRLELRERETADRAAALLGPAQPFRAEPDVLRFDAARDGTATGPDGVTRLLTRLDDDGIGGTLTLASSKQAPPRAARGETLLADAWDTALAGLPPDWSDLLCELDAALDRLRRARRRALHPDEPAPRRRPRRAALPLRARVGLRRLARDGPPLLRALRPRGHPRHGDGAARAHRHPPRRTQGPVWQLDGRPSDGRPGSWLLIEPGWDVVDANGERIGKVDEVLGEREPTSGTA